MVQAQPGQLIVEHLTVGFAEVAVLDAPIRDGAADAMDKLPHGSLALRRALLAVKIFGHDNLGGQQRPRLGRLDVFLFENHLPGVVVDLGGAPFPFDLIERVDFCIAENAFDGQRFFRRGSVGLARAGSSKRGRARAVPMGSNRQNLFIGINHGFFLY